MIFIPKIIFHKLISKSNVKEYLNFLESLWSRFLGRLRLRLRLQANFPRRLRLRLRLQQKVGDSDSDSGDSDSDSTSLVETTNLVIFCPGEND